jgi:serine/threonine protein kinase
VHRSSDPSKELIAKKLRDGSNELEILRILDTTQPKSEHVISLLDSFYTHPGQWVILPQMDTVAAYLWIAPSKLDDSVARICWGLIKGLAYLHMHNIAHRDIKPDNLVVDNDFCLKIIDFDVAMQVKDEDEEVDDYCGTKYWIAPEVEKATLMYSPIRADRWSCGHVILYLLDELGKEDNPLRAVARKLKVQNPKQRPSLLKWGIWDSAPLQNIPDVGKVGEQKILQPRQDTIEVDEASTKPPKAKKQRLTVCDQSEG